MHAPGNPWRVLALSVVRDCDDGGERAGEVRDRHGEHHGREKSEGHLRQENRELREMLIQNGLFIRIAQGLTKLGLEPPADMRDLTMAMSAEKYRATLVSQMPQVPTPLPHLCVSHYGFVPVSASPRPAECDGGGGGPYTGAEAFGAVGGACAPCERPGAAGDGLPGRTPLPLPEETKCHMLLPRP